MAPLPTVLALLMSTFACAAAAAGSGRDGGPALGCNSVTDGHGAVVSGREGGTSVSTRLHRECPAGEPPAAPSARPKISETPSAKGPPPERVVAEQPKPVPVLSGEVKAPSGTVETPSALGGDVVRAGATVVTSGVMIWLLHSSLLASLLVLGVPIWRHVDLLAVVSNPEEVAQAAAADPEDPTLTRVLEAGSAASRAAEGAGRQI